MKTKKYQQNLTFVGRFEPMEEPRMTIKNGPRIYMDSTRMTQHGNWSGLIKFKSNEVDLSEKKYVGTRDRSWGIRPVGSQDSQIVPPIKLPNFIGYGLL